MSELSSEPVAERLRAAPDRAGPADRGIDLDVLVARAAALAARPGRAILGITGSPGAGKSTLVAALLAGLAELMPDGGAEAAVAHVPMDGFHLADVALARIGQARREGRP